MFRNRWNVLNGVRAIDGKHMIKKKPKKSSSDYYNYKGFFSPILLALVNAEYKFLWIDSGSNDSCSDVQIFNKSVLRKIEEGSLGLPAPEPLGGQRARYAVLFAGLRCFCLNAMDGETLHQKTTHKGRKNSQLQDLQRQEGCSKHIWSWFRVLLGTMGQRPRVGRDIGFTCVVLKTHQGGADDVAALQNEQVVYVPNENCRNPLREAKQIIPRIFI